MSNPSEARCPRCAAPLPPSAPEGLCPRCLGALNLATDTVLTGADAIAAQPPLTPAELAPHFPQLEIIECLGRGGMGVVYRVRQKALNRLAALKLLAPERVTDAGFAERFTREAQALARLNHPNIVTIYDFGATTPPQTPDAIPHPPFYFLLMEFVDGVNLRQAMKAGRFTPEQALAIVPPVCEALQYAHEHGIVHRDIKPENLLLDKNGRIKIADFGIAKLVARHSDVEFSAPDSPPAQVPALLPDSTLESRATAAGTPGYMAPEQSTAPQRVDRRADIYSLGVVLYELLTGELPAAQLQPPSRKVQIDVRLDEIVLRALETKPELRFQTAVEMRTQVEELSKEKRENRGEKVENSPAPPPLSSPAPPFLKLTTATLLTPMALATLHGQLFAYQTRGQLILDTQRLTHTRAGHTTVIPLAAIRDVSLGQYPRSMNPVGISLVSVTYEDAGQLRQVLLSPMDGWLAFPATWDANAADWHAAIRAAVKAATGREPTTTPREQLGIPGSFPWLQLAMVAVPVVAGLGLLSAILWQTGNSVRSVMPVIIITLVLGFGFLIPGVFVPWATRRRASTPPAVPGTRSPLLKYGLALLCMPLVIHLLMLPAQLLLPEPARRGAPLPIGFPEAIILAVLGVVGLLRLRQPPATAKSPGRNLLGLGLICFGMFLGGMKIQEASRDHSQRVSALTSQIPRVQKEWHAGHQRAFDARTELARFETRGPAPATEPERQRHALEHERLKAEVVKAQAHSYFIEGQLRATHDKLNGQPFPTLPDFAFVLQWSLPFVLAGLLVLAWRGSSRREEAPSSGFQHTGLLLLAMPVVLVGFLFLQFYARQSEPTGVTHFSFTPIGVSNNVVIVDVTTEVGRGNAELRAMLDGPPLPAGTDAALADAFFPPFAGTFIKPTPHAGNHPWRILSAGGRQTWRLGFVLPDAALAKEAFESLHPVGSLPAVPDRTYAGTLFEVRQTNGQVFHASLQVALPFTAADTNWVSVSTMATYNESIVTMNWEVLASQPGTVRCQREGNRSTAQLQLDAKSKLYRVPVRLELTKVSTNRVLLVTAAGGSKSREEFTGSFRELSAELVRFINLSAKTVRGAEIELCQFQGKSFTVRVDALPPPMTTAVPTKVVRWGFSGMPLWPVLAVVVLTVIIGGIVLVVVLARKGGAGGKIALLLVGAAGLFVAVALAALLAWRKASSDFGPGFGLTRLGKVSQMVLESNYQTSAQPFRSGTVLGTQNGFILQLPAAQLASFEFFIRQADDSWQPIPALTALVATGTNATYRAALHWKLERGDRTDRLLTTNQLWFWSVHADAGPGSALPQLTDHGTNFTHTLAPGEILNWWQLATPPQTALKPGEQRIIPLFRTHGNATVSGKHPKEAFVRVRCEPLPAGLNVAPGQQLTEAGLAAHALLAKVLPAKNPASTPPNQPEAVPLVRREVKQANPGGKDLVMTFEELRRDAKTSIATVRHVSGASVPSAMFIARGAYDIARARGAAYFLNLKEWDAEDGTRRYLIGFAPDKNVDPQTYFDLKEPLPTDKRLLFLSVQAYERVFKDQP